MKATIFSTSGSPANSHTDCVYPFGENAVAEEQRMIGLAQPMQVGARRAAAAQADDVQSDQVLQISKAEWNDVGADPCHSANHGALTDAVVLMNGGQSADKCVIANRNMAAKHDVVGEGHGIANVAIMPDVTTYHDKAALADAGHAAAVFGAGIHCDVLAHLAARPERQARRAAAIMH